MLVSHRAYWEEGGRRCVGFMQLSLDEGAAMEKDRSLTTLNIVGILALYCCMSEFTILTPSVASFAAHFQNTSYTTILLANSITGIVSVPISILIGAIVNRVGFRPLGVAGILLMSLGGAFPFMLSGLTDYSFIIFSRIVVGIGLGFLFPLAGSLIIVYFNGEDRGRYLGRGITLQFVFAIIYTVIAGFLTNIGWNYSFLAYLVALIPLMAVVLWLPEGKNLMSFNSKVQAEKSRTKEKIPRAVLGYALFGLAAWIATVTVQLICSSVLDVRGLGDAGMASIVISASGVGTIISGIAFPRVLRVLKQRVFGVCSVLVIVGLIPCFYATNAAMYGVGVFLIGFGGSAFFTAAQNSTGNLSPKTRIPFINGLMTSMMNLGPFFAPYIVSASALAVPSLGISAVFPVCIAMMVVCAVFGFVLPFKAISKAPE